VKGSDKAILLGVVMAVVLGFFFFTVLSPKRDKASQLGKDVSDMKAQVAQEEQVAQYGEQARSQFPRFYARLVVLGKAVPSGADTGSLLVELSAIAHQTDVKFQGISLDSGGGGTSASASSSASASTTPSSSTSSSGTDATGSSTSTSGTGTTSTPSGPSASTSGSTATRAANTTPAPATEASAANLPLGAVVGPGDLGVMPYSLTFQGSYFQVADFLKGLDDLIHTRGSSEVAADGRLMTIDGFSLAEPLGLGPNPQLKVAVEVTSYVAPASQGLTAGASPGGPAPSSSVPQTQPASAAVSAP
jgi:Tfp pilus assembly protein PilO